LAIQAMREIGIDISGQQSKALAQILQVQVQGKPAGVACAL
jgi:hypothetical protein